MTQGIQTLTSEPPKEVVSRKANGTDILSGCQGLFLSYGSIFKVTLVVNQLKKH